MNEKKIVNYKRLGDEIRARRLLLGMTQEQLAERSELSVTHISNLENGKVSLSLESFVSICKALDMSTDELLSGTTNIGSHPKFNDIISLLSGCNEKELSIVTEVMRSLIRAVIKNRKI